MSPYSSSADLLGTAGVHVAASQVADLLDHSAALNEVKLPVPSSLTISFLEKSVVRIHGCSLHRLVPELVREFDIDGADERHVGLPLLVRLHRPVGPQEEARRVPVLRRWSMSEVACLRVNPLLQALVSRHVGRPQLLHQRVGLTRLAVAALVEMGVLLWICGLAWLVPPVVVALALHQLSLRLLTGSSLVSMLILGIWRQGMLL